MALLRLFGPSRAKVWRELSKKLGGQYHEGGFFGTDRVQVHVSDWIVTLDTYTESSGNSSQTYTRLRAPYVNSEGLRFTIYRSGFLSTIGKSLGLVQDIEVGFPRFDREFIIQGNDPQKVCALFANPRIRTLLESQPRVHLHVADDEGWFGPTFPEGVDELYFRVPGVVKDLGRLERLFALFAEILHHLGHLSSGYKHDAAILIEELNGPGGTIQRNNIVLWDGNARRRRAAQMLGEHRGALGVVPALMNRVEDPDPVLRSLVMRSLAKAGDARAIPVLIPLLGSERDALGARQALEALGHYEFLERFDAALHENPDRITEIYDVWRAPTTTALLWMLDHSSNEMKCRAARALGALHATHAASKMRKVARQIRSDEAASQTLVQVATQLEQFSTLPRSSGHQNAEERLPRPAADDPVDPTKLPRSSND